MNRFEVGDKAYTEYGKFIGIISRKLNTGIIVSDKDNKNVTTHYKSKNLLSEIEMRDLKFKKLLNG